MEEDDISVQVAVRIRPQSTREVVDMCQVCTNVVPGEPQIALGKDVSFTYNYVFDVDADQTTVFDTCVASLVDGTLRGYNSTIFAYGQTGSGKTYTMGTGFDVDLSPDHVGMIPRAINRLFDNMNTYRRTARDNGLVEPEFGVTAQFIELYNEEIIDLLDPSAGKDRLYKIHEDTSGSIEVKGVASKTVTSAEEALKCLRMGALSRTTASTKMNTQSSRSHAVYTLHVRQQRVTSYDNFDEVETLTAKVHFVDLAGSERLKRTGATGERAKEGISINCGLLALGNVISALGDRTKRALHVPYRDSKLTRLLQDSLGGNSRTVMIACISPSDCDFMETLNTLKYSNRARNIRNKIVANRDKTSNIIMQLRKQVAELQREIVEYKQGKRLIAEDGSESVNDMFYENNMLQVEVNNLRTRIKAMQNTVDSLTQKNSKLLAEKALISAGGEVDVDMAFMIESYLKEIEELSAKLIESNNMCEQFRQKINRYRLSSQSGTIFPENDLLEAAKISLQREKNFYEQNSRTDLQNDHEFDTKSQEDRDDYIMLPTDSNMKEELLTLTEDIDMKQKLIDELELSQKRLHSMRQHYEDKLVQLQQRIRNTQEERDKVFHLYQHRAEPSDKLKSVKDEYAKKLSSMQKELAKLQAAQKEHARLLRNQGNYEQQLVSYRNEVTQMKRTKVNLINKMKEESQKHREAELRKTREIAQLRKESRKKENVIKTMEAEMMLREKVLKRKQEEVSYLRKNQAGHLHVDVTGRASSSRFLTGQTKKKWVNLEKAITNIAWTNKGLVEKEIRMERLLEKRELLRKESIGFEKRRELALSKDQDVTHLDNYIEDIKENISYVQELISELQYSIVEVEGIQDTNDHQNVNNIVKTINDIKEAKYIISKLYNMTLSQSHMVAQSDAKWKEAEASLLELQQEHLVTGQLLDHVLHNEVPLFSHGVASEAFSDSASSAPSSGSPSLNSLQYLDMPSTGQQSDKHSSKIRGRTVMPAELLFGLNTDDKAV